MKRISYSEFQKRLGSRVDAVSEDGEPLLIARRNAPNVVLMSERDYEGLMETVHLLNSPANADRLLRSIEEARGST